MDSEINIDHRVSETEVSQIIHVIKRALEKKDDYIIRNELLDGRPFAKSIALGDSTNINYLIPIVDLQDTMKGYISVKIDVNNEIIDRKVYDFQAIISAKETPSIDIDIFKKAGYKTPKSILSFMQEKTNENAFRISSLFSNNAQYSKRAGTTSGTDVPTSTVDAQIRFSPVVTFVSGLGEECIYYALYDDNGIGPIRREIVEFIKDYLNTQSIGPYCVVTSIGTEITIEVSELPIVYLYKLDPLLAQDKLNNFIATEKYRFLTPYMRCLGTDPTIHIMYYSQHVTVNQPALEEEEPDDPSGDHGGNLPNPPKSHNPGNDYSAESTDEGINLNYRLNCFNNIPDNGNTKYVVQLLADLPVDNDPNALIGLVDQVGHSFISLNKINGGVSTTEIFGFYPKVGYKSLFNAPVPSQIQDNGLHEYDALLTRSVSKNEFEAMLNAAKNNAMQNYDLKNFNCTDYAVSVFNAGMDNGEKITVVDWIVISFDYANGAPVTRIDNYGTTPTGLYKTLSKMSIDGYPGVTKFNSKVLESTKCN
jgi:hypothetical protein